MSETTARGDILQIHALTTYPSVLLNRDDAGMPKQIPYGPAMRTRVSSQCQKKRWRESDILGALGPMAVRSRQALARHVIEPLVEDHGVDEKEASVVAEYLINNLGGKKPKNSSGDGEGSGKRKKKDEDKEVGETNQILVFGREELDYLCDVALQELQKVWDAGKKVTKLSDLPKKISNETKNNLRALPKSIDQAMFGRMTTGDMLSVVPSAVSVSHAFTTHEAQREDDYFTAVDTILQEEGRESGAAITDSVELTSGTFYTYVSVDIPRLRQNLGPDRAHMAEAICRALIYAVGQVSPGAKQGSSAPFAHASFLLAERGSYQPRSLAAAFEEPVPTDQGSITRTSVERLLKEREANDTMWGTSPEKAAAATKVDLDNLDPNLFVPTMPQASDVVLGPVDE